MNILFVCTGNVSRSFFAEMLLKNEINRLKLKDTYVMSAGVSVYRGAPADPKMVKFLVEKEIPVQDHSSRPLDSEGIAWADRILVMEKAHQTRIEDQWPEAREKIQLLGAYIAPGSIADDIIDPYGGSPYHYRLAQSQITVAINSLLKELIRQKNTGIKDMDAKD